jgi:hypothetical protein
MLRFSRAWLIVLGCLWMGGCGGSQSPAPEAAKAGLPELSEFTSKECRFKVLMPGKPKEEILPDESDSMKTFMVGNDRGVFCVGYGSHRPIESDSPTAQNWLDVSAKETLRGQGSTLLTMKKIVLAGKYPGREMTGNWQNGKGIVRARIYLVERRYYQTVVLGQQEFVNSEAAQKFLDSFTIIR